MRDVMMVLQPSFVCAHECLKLCVPSSLNTNVFTNCSSRFSSIVNALFLPKFIATDNTFINPTVNGAATSEPFLLEGVDESVISGTVIE